MLVYVLKISTAIVLIGLILPIATLYPRPGQQVAVLFPPWIEKQVAAERIRASGGVILSDEGLAVVAAGFSDDFYSRLFRNGAVLILDAKRVAILCGARTV